MKKNANPAKGRGWMAEMGKEAWWTSILPREREEREIWSNKGDIIL